MQTTPLTEMTTDTGNSDPVSQKPYPIEMKNYQWIKEEIEKLLTAKVICSSRSSWSATIIVVLNGDGGKRLVIDNCTLNKVTRKFTWHMPKVEGIFSKLNGATPAYFQELMTGILKDFNFTIAYLNDITIFSRTAEERLLHIKQVFEKL